MFKNCLIQQHGFPTTVRKRNTCVSIFSTGNRRVSDRQCRHADITRHTSTPMEETERENVFGEYQGNGDWKILDQNEEESIENQKGASINAVQSPKLEVNAFPALNWRNIHDNIIQNSL